ncbi:MAG: nucleotide sugar dehydrogenase [Actinomycetota bacterium]
MTTSFAQRVDGRSTMVAVVGLGYVGLPLVVAFAEVGFPTLGFDVSAKTVDGLNAGQSHIDDISSERVAAILSAKKFRATTTSTDLSSADVVFICVPTPFDKAKTPDLSFVESATRTVASALRKDMLVILQSTTYPGTTVEFVKPILESTGLVAGKDFHLAFSPERVDPGNATWHIRNTPKVVGGLTPECTERSRSLLTALMDSPDLVHPVESPAVAEMSKLLENTYRAVNIALVNELAQLCNVMGIDVWDVINAAATKPFGFQAFYPGIGPGGHCIPVDPHYLAWKAREFEFQTRFIELAADVNSQMASYAVSRIQNLLNQSNKPLSGSSILCLGAAFKGGVSDTRNSRAMYVMELLAAQGANVSYCDPHVPSVTIAGRTITSASLVEAAQTKADLVAVLVGSPNWPMRDLEQRGVAVFDAVNAGGSNTANRQRL